jgi:hypothetical protein
MKLHIWVEVVMYVEVEENDFMTTKMVLLTPFSHDRGFGGGVNRFEAKNE